MINNFSELRLNHIYYICMLPDEKKSVRKAELLGVINEFEDVTELYIELNDGPNKGVRTILWAKEIGIGYTKDEALNGYGKYIYEDIPGAYKSRKECSIANRKIYN